MKILSPSKRKFNRQEGPKRKERKEDQGLMHRYLRKCVLNRKIPLRSYYYTRDFSLDFLTNESFLYFVYLKVPKSMVRSLRLLSMTLLSMNQKELRGETNKVVLSDRMIYKRDPPRMISKVSSCLYGIQGKGKSYAYPSEPSELK